MSSFDGGLQGMELQLGGYAAAVEARLARFEAEGVGARVWAKDHAVWSAEPAAELWL